MNKEYPRIEIDLKKLGENIDQVVSRCEAAGVSVAGVVKGFNGILPAVKQFAESRCSSIASSRLEHLQEARALGIRGPFMAIRVGMISEAGDLVRLADISLQSELATVRALQAECQKQNRRHQVILMVDLGDLREGYFDWQELVDCAVTIEQELPHITLLGVGTNLGCYGSINPTVANMNQLIEAAEAIEKAIGRPLEVLSGGGTTSLPLVLSGEMPKRINHLRIGEGISLGKDLQDLWGIDMSYLHPDVFTVKAEIIEVKKKPSYPIGEIFVDCFGNKGEYEDRGIRRRGLLGLGKLDFAMTDMLIPRAPGVEVLGGSSDHLIVDLEDSEQAWQVGDVMEFDVRYATMMYTTASRYLNVVCK